MNARRAWVVGAACGLAVVAAACVVLALIGPSGGGTSGRAASASSPRPRTGRPGLLVVGASYSAALGATSPRRGYADLVGAQLGWQVHVAAVPGSGYLNPGPMHQGTFRQRLRRVHLRFDPRLVLIQGGRNDADFAPTQLRNAVCATVAEARARFAAAQVVLLGNVPFHLPVPPKQRWIARTLHAAAARCHVPFIDPIAENWISRANERGFLGPVPDHPNDAGYEYIAARLLVDLRRLGVITDTSA